jgi:type IV pilus assembly protein PilB
LLVERSLITCEQLETALTRQKKEGGRIGSTLVKLGYITEEELLRFLSMFYDVPQVDLQHAAISAEALCLLSAEKARSCAVLPFRLMERPPDRPLLFVATPDPTNFDALDAVHTATGYDIEPFVCSYGSFAEAIERAYGRTSSADDVHQMLAGMSSHRLVEALVKLLMKKKVLTPAELNDVICEIVSDEGEEPHDA